MNTRSYGILGRLISSPSGLVAFFTGLAISQILPFLPLYVSQLGVTSHEALSMWSGLTFSVTFSCLGDRLANVGKPGGP